MSPHRRFYPARVVRIVDGDTLEVECDLGMGISRRVTCRLLGVDTHETYGVSHDSAEYRHGKREEQFVRGWVTEGATMSTDDHPFEIRITGKGKYGRHLAELERDDGAILTDDLVDEFGDPIVN